MQNILDYFTWRGDLSFTQDGVNEVDNLIMSSLAYLNFDGIISPPSVPQTLSLSEVAECAMKHKDRFAALDHIPFFKQIPSLLYKAAESPRYCDITLSSYMNIIDHQQSGQFSAVVFSINPNLHFIAFRGLMTPSPAGKRISR
jgi:hypothetical protein